MASLNVSCGPCKAGGITKPADDWCRDCEEGLCNSCKEQHSGPRPSRDHNIIPVEEYIKFPTAISNGVRYCKDHNQRNVRYCERHDQLCCLVCIDSNHKECKKLKTIPQLIETSKSTSILLKVGNGLREINNKISKVTRDKEEILSKISDQRNGVTRMHEEINFQLDLLENTIAGAVDEVNEHIKRILNTKEKVDELDTSRSAVANYASGLQTIIGGKALLKEVNTIKENVQSELDGCSNIKLVIDEKVSNMISYLQKFRMVWVTQKPSPKTIYDIKVSLKSVIESNCNGCLSGCAVLPNGKLVLCKSNTCLVILNREDSSVDKKINIINSVRDFTVINDKVVVVSSFKCIDVIDLDEGKRINRIPTNNKNYGITIRGKQVLWCEGSKGVLAREPMKPRGNLYSTTLVKDVQFPHRSYIAALGHNIYTTSPSCNTVTCYQRGLKMWDFKCSSTYRADGRIAVDNNHNVYIAARSDNKVVVISPDGKKGRQLLTKKDGIDDPSGIYLDKERNLLIVANENGRVFLYNISST